MSMTPNEIDNKIEACAAKLVGDHSMEELQAMHHHAFGVACKINAKPVLAMKLAKWTVLGLKEETGNDSHDVDVTKAKMKRVGSENKKIEIEDQTIQPDKSNGKSEASEQSAAPMSVREPLEIPENPTAEEEKKLAVTILSRLQGVWSEHESLIEKRKAEISEMRQQIGLARDKIGEAMASGTDNADKKLELIEAHWRTLVKVERKKAAVTKDLNQRIKDAKQTVTSELNNARQLSLFQ